MAQYLTMARPYAVALFEAYQNEPQKLLAWEEILQVLALLVEQTQLMSLVFNPKVSTPQLENILLDTLHSVLPKAVSQVENKLKNFLHLIIENKRLNTLPDLFSLYKKLVAKKQNKMEIEVTSAFPLDQKQMDEMKKALGKRFNTEVVIQFSIDKSLIGGAVIRTDEFVIDGSVRDRLTRLYHSLNS